MQVMTTCVWYCFQSGNELGQGQGFQFRQCMVCYGTLNCERIAQHLFNHPFQWFQLGDHPLMLYVGGPRAFKYPPVSGVYIGLVWESMLQGSGLLLSVYSV